MSLHWADRSRQLTHLILSYKLLQLYFLAQLGVALTKHVHFHHHSLVIPALHWYLLFCPGELKLVQVS